MFLGVVQRALNEGGLLSARAATYADEGARPEAASRPGDTSICACSARSSFMHPGPRPGRGATAHSGAGLTPCVRARAHGVGCHPTPCHVAGRVMRPRPPSQREASLAPGAAKVARRVRGRVCGLIPARAGVTPQSQPVDRPARGTPPVTGGLFGRRAKGTPNPNLQMVCRARGAGNCATCGEQRTLDRKVPGHAASAAGIRGSGGDTGRAVEPKLSRVAS